MIIAAGDAQTAAAAHDLIAPAGRILVFAGAHGRCSVECGVRHYGNAAIVGPSGCNTNQRRPACLSASPQW